MKNTTTNSNIRIPLYNKKGVEVYICAGSKGRISLDIRNNSGLPRLVALANALSDGNPTIVQMTANSLRKMPWATDVRKLRNLEVTVSESVEESLDMNKNLD